MKTNSEKTKFHCNLSPQQIIDRPLWISFCNEPVKVNGDQSACVDYVVVFDRKFQ